MWLKSGIILFMCVNHILAFRIGAGTSACATMMPNHEGNVPQTTEPPYTISVSSRNVIQGDVLTVTIEDPSGLLQFRGFIIQAITTISPRRAVGTFFESSTTRHIACVGDFTPGSFLTHRDSTLKSNITLTWQAPIDHEGSVTFKATVVNNFATFWTEIRSESVLISAINFFNPYEGCATRKTCFGSPRGCLSNENCDMFGSVELVDGSFIFETLSQVGMNYVAIALSDDAFMGRDSVIECVRGANNVMSFTSFTVRQDPIFESPRIDDQSIIRLLQSRLENGRLYCRVERDSMTTVQGMQFDLVNDKHYLLLAMGTETTTNAIGTHGPWSEYSEEAVLLTQPRNLEPGGTRLLIMVHGSFMIVAWIGTASIGIFFASYFKKTWTNQTIFGKDVWFVCHTTCMMLTWLLTIASFIIIFVETGEWRTSVHAVTGTITTALVIIQPVGAVFRPKPESHNRPIFKLIHSAKGIFMYRLAIITLLFAVPLPAARLPSWTSFILVGFIVFYLKMNFFMTLIGTLGEMKRKKQPGSSKHAPYTILRKTILGFFIIVILLFVITLVLILAWPA